MRRRRSTHRFELCPAGLPCVTSESEPSSTGSPSLTSRRSLASVILMVRTHEGGQGTRLIHFEEELGNLDNNGVCIVIRNGCAECEYRGGDGFDRFPDRRFRDEISERQRTDVYPDEVVRLYRNQRTRHADVRRMQKLGNHVVKQECLAGGLTGIRGTSLGSIGGTGNVSGMSGSAVQVTYTKRLDGGSSLRFW